MRVWPRDRLEHEDRVHCSNCGSASILVRQGDKMTHDTRADCVNAWDVCTGALKVERRLIVCQSLVNEAPTPAVTTRKD